MENLVKGVHAFQEEVFRPEREMFERLAKGQSPETLFITCSDSRISPNLLTGTQPGELFILRNAGNIVPPFAAISGGEAATIEYAVSVLGVQDIIICGHSLCGAIDALMNPEKLDDLPAVKSWLAHAAETKSIVEKTYEGLSSEALANVAVQENVLVQIEHLKTLPCVASRLADHSLGLHAWVYLIETGEVCAYDPGGGQFLPLTLELADVGARSRGRSDLRPI